MSPTTIPKVLRKAVVATLDVLGARVFKTKKAVVKINAPEPFKKNLLYDLKLNQPVSPIPVLCGDMMEISGSCCWRGRECKSCVMDTSEDYEGFGQREEMEYVWEVEKEMERMEEKKREWRMMVEELRKRRASTMERLSPFASGPRTHPAPTEEQMRMSREWRLMTDEVAKRYESATTILIPAKSSYQNGNVPSIAAGFQTPPAPTTSSSVGINMAIDDIQPDPTTFPPAASEIPVVHDNSFAEQEAAPYDSELLPSSVGSTTTASMAPESPASSSTSSTLSSPPSTLAASPVLPGSRAPGQVDGDDLSRDDDCSWMDENAASSAAPSAAPPSPSSTTSFEELLLGNKSSHATPASSLPQSSAGPSSDSLRDVASGGYPKWKGSEKPLFDISGDGYEARQAEWQALLKATALQTENEENLDPESKPYPDTQQQQKPFADGVDVDMDDGGRKGKGKDKGTGKGKGKGKEKAGAYQEPQHYYAPQPGQPLRNTSIITPVWPTNFNNFSHYQAESQAGPAPPPTPPPQASNPIPAFGPTFSMFGTENEEEEEEL